MVSVVLFSLALGISVTPIEKVISLLNDLETQVIDEGKEEAKTYDKFACFCKDNAEAKSEAIKNGNADKEDLEASLNTSTTDRGAEQTNKADAAARIVELKDEKRTLNENRAKERREYDVKILDLQKAVQALENAIELIQASRGSGAEALIHMKKTVKRALLMAEALGHHVTTELLEAPFDAETQDYSFHSDSILDTLKGLLTDFQGQRTTTDEEEVAAKQAHDTAVQGISDTLEAEKKKEEDATKAIATHTTDIGQSQGDLTSTNAQLLDDQAFLSELTSNCNARATLYHQRSDTRAQELSAIHQATEIMKTRVAEIETAPTRLIQQKKQRRSQVDALSFVQISHSGVAAVKKHQSRGFLAPHSALVRVAELLRNKMEKLKNGTFLKMAVRAAEKDPFEKVKTLIQELIGRLQQEASDEQDHNNWCKGETARATQTRDIKSENVQRANQDLAKNETHRDKLMEQIALLQKEVKQLNTDLDEAQSLRDEEHAEYQKTVADAKLGSEAVKEALDILTKFYDEAKKNAGEGEYQGAGGSASGVLGMLEVVKSDFDRTEALAEKGEHAAVLQHTEFKGTTEASIAAKTKIEEDKDADLTQTNASIDANRASFEENQSLLEAAIVELIQLHNSCVATGQSYEERVAAREEEIAALKQALCILDAQQNPTQGDNC